jgi:5-methyltetrahydrofolate--homocysteine methyltransferase
MDLLTQLSESLKAGEEEKAGELTRQAIREGLPPREILERGLIAGMTAVGEQFKAHEIFLPEVLLAAKAMTAGTNELKPLLLKEGIPTLGKVVLGTVQGDLHDIGKNLVGIMLRGAGFEVIDLGKDVSPQKFVEAAKKEGAGVIGMSALLTTTMPAMRSTVALLKEQGLAGKVKTIIGGAPVTAEYAREIGADAQGYDGTSAVEEMKRLIRGT